MNEPRGRDVPGIIGSAAFIVMGVLAWYHSSEFSALGSVFPRTMAAGMVLLSIVYIAVAILRPGAKPGAPGGSNARRLALVVVLVAWSALIETVGFLATSTVAYAAIMVIANYDRWTPRLAVAYVAAGAVVLGGFYAIFRLALQVPLPPGMLL